FHYGPGPCSLQYHPQIYDYPSTPGDHLYGDEGCSDTFGMGLPQTHLDSFVGSTPQLPETPLKGSLDRVVPGGAQANPGLPKVNHGSFIGTPGDNLYTYNPTRAVEVRPATHQPPGLLHGYYQCEPIAQQPVTPSQNNLEHDMGTIFGSRTNFK